MNRKVNLLNSLIFVGIVGCMGSSHSWAASTTMDDVQHDNNSSLTKVDMGQGWYYCAKSSVNCSLWNATKVVNIDPYKDIHYDIGSFRFSVPKGRPTLTSEDNRFKVSLGMMIQLDTGGFIGKNDRDKGPSMAGTKSHLRRGRFIVSAQYDDFVITVTPDLGTAGTQNDSLFEASLKYKGIRHTSLEVGLLQPRITLEDIAGSPNVEFVERATILDLVRNIAAANARLSLGGTHWEKDYYVGAYVTGPRYGPFKNFQDNQIGGVIRAAGRVYSNRDIDLMFGAAGSIAFHGKNRNYSMSTSSEAQIWLSRSYLKTGTMNGVDNIWSLGPQFGLRWKRFLLQSEYYSIHMQRVAVANQNQPNLRFYGWYASLNYTLFGQPRLYDSTKAVFAPPVGPVFNPTAGYWGALEWSGRVSYTDLNSNLNDYSSNGKLLGVKGGTETVWSTGFNWYPSSSVRVMLEYNHIRTTSSPKSEYSFKGRNSNLMISRLQLVF